MPKILQSVCAVGEGFPANKLKIECELEITIFKKHYSCPSLLWGGLLLSTVYEVNDNDDQTITLLVQNINLFQLRKNFSTSCLTYKSTTSLSGDFFAQNSLTLIEMKQLPQLVTNILLPKKKKRAF